MPIRTPDGYLDITNATLRGSEIITTSKVGIANSAPTHTLSVGNKLFVDDSAANVLTVSGNLVATSLKIGQIDLTPSYGLEHVANVINTVSNVVQFTNTGTGFVSVSNVGIGTSTSPAGLLDVVGAFRMRYQDMGVTKAHIITGANSASISESGGTYTYTRGGSGNTGNFLPNPSNIVPNVGQRYRVKLTARSDYAGTIRYECPTSTIITTYDLTTSFKEYTWDFTATGTTMQFAVTTVSGTTSQFNAFSIERLGVGFNVNPTSTAAPVQISGVTHFSDNVGIGVVDPNNKLTINGGTGVSSSGGVMGIRQKGDTLDDGITLTSSNTNSTRMYKDANGHFYLYNTGGGTFAFQNVTGNVGIGTNNPIAKLDIDGGAENNTTPALAIRGGLYNTSDLYVLNSYSVTSGVGYGAKVIGVNIKNKVETDNTVQIRNNVGGLTSAGAIYFGSDDTTYQGIFGVLGGTGNAGTTLSELLTVKGNGNVGIGAANPNQKLEVHGNILLGNNDVDSFIHGGASVAMSADTNILIVADSNDTSGAAPAGDIIFGSGSAFDTNQNRDFTYAQAYPSNVPRNEHMRITGDGNVGIGTASPSMQLDCYVGATAYAGIQVRSSSGYAKLIANAAQGGHNSIVKAGDLGIVFSTDSAPSTNEANKGFYIAPWANDTSGIRINENGNVGIGTASPLARLDVQGTGAAPLTSHGTTTAIMRTRATNTNVVLDQGALSSSPWSYWMQVSDSNNLGLEYPLALNPNGGNVGIGTASPSYPLDLSFAGDSGMAIRSTTSHTSLNFFPNSGYSYLRFHEANGSSSVWLQALAGGHLAIRPQGGSETVRFNANGNVGIGTASPDGRLHICSGTSGDCHLIIQSDTDNNNEQDNPKIVFRQDGEINTAEIGIENSGGNPNMLALRGTAGIVFYDGETNTGDIDKIQSTSTEHMRIESNGKVGIDDSTPTHRFTVANRHGIEADGYWARYRVGTGLSNNYRIYFRSSSMNSSAGGGSDNVSIYVNNLSSANDASDDRIKTDEVLVENATQTLLKLKPQTYTKDIFEFDELTSEEYSNTESTTDGYVFSPTHDRWRKRRFAGRPQKETGLIIQDIWYDTPELRHIIRLADDAEPAEERPNIEDIQQDPDYDALGWGLDASQLKYQQLIPYLIKSNQEIYTELQAEKTKTTSLETKTTALETKLQEAEAKIATLQAEKEAIRSDLSSLVLRVAALES